MNRALIAGFFKLAAMSASCIEHVSTIKRATNAEQNERTRILAEYTSTLSPQALMGFRCTLLYLMNREKDVTRKAVMRSLLQHAGVGDSVNAQMESPQEVPSTAAAPASDVDRDLRLVSQWLDDLKPEERKKALVKHLLTLDQPGYTAFAAKLRQFRKHCGDHIEQHKANEAKFGGRVYLEDQINYRQLKLCRPGWCDPEWLRVLKEFEETRSKFDWVIEASDRAWQAIRQSKSGTANQRSSVEKLSTVQR